MSRLLASTVAESLLAFWAEAGVDAVLLDTPPDRIAEGQRPLAPRLAPAPVVRSGTPSAVPARPLAIEAARQAASACGTLESLAEAIEAFEGCPIRFEGAATRSVFSRGPADAPVVVIGEAPGAEEDRSGRPFVGKAGQMLDRMLDAIGLTDRAFITNTVFWRPPGNRTPTPAEQAVCRPFLENAVFLIKPKLLLLVGGAAAKSVLGVDEGIMSLRGRWFEWSDSEKRLNLPVLPTLHPAFLLRTPQAKKLAWFDILTFVERLDRPERAP